MEYDFCYSHRLIATREVGSQKNWNCFITSQLLKVCKEVSSSKHKNSELFTLQHLSDSTNFPLSSYDLQEGPDQGSTTNLIRSENFIMSKRWNLN